MGETDVSNGESTGSRISSMPVDGAGGRFRGERDGNERIDDLGSCGRGRTGCRCGEMDRGGESDEGEVGWVGVEVPVGDGVLEREMAIVGCKMCAVLVKPNEGLDSVAKNVGGEAHGRRVGVDGAVLNRTDWLSSESSSSEDGRRCKSEKVESCVMTESRYALFLPFSSSLSTSDVFCSAQLQLWTWAFRPGGTLGCD